MKKVLFGLILLSTVLVACSGNRKNEVSVSDNSSVKTSESSNKPTSEKKSLLLENVPTPSRLILQLLLTQNILTKMEIKL